MMVAGDGSASQSRVAKQHCVNGMGWTCLSGTTLMLSVLEGNVSFQQVNSSVI